MDVELPWIPSLRGKTIETRLLHRNTSTGLLRVGLRLAEQIPEWRVYYVHAARKRLHARASVRHLHSSLWTLQVTEDVQSQWGFFFFKRNETCLSIWNPFGPHFSRFLDRHYCSSSCRSSIEVFPLSLFFLFLHIYGQNPRRRKTTSPLNQCFKVSAESSGVKDEVRVKCVCERVEWVKKPIWHQKWGNSSAGQTIWSINKARTKNDKKARAKRDVR